MVQSRGALHRVDISVPKTLQVTHKSCPPTFIQPGVVSPVVREVRRQTPYLLRENPLAASGGPPDSLRGVGDLKTVPVEVTHWPLVARLRGNQRGGIPRSVQYNWPRRAFRSPREEVVDQVLTDLAPRARARTWSQRRHIESMEAP